MAWLNATPKPPTGSERAKALGDKKLPTRIEAMRAQNEVPRMPPNPAPHIIDRLIEIGLTEAAGMGIAPLSWCEIDAWCRRTCVAVTPWEARLIRSLSIAYVAEARAAESENASPPWRTEPTERERAMELARLEMVLG